MVDFVITIVGVTNTVDNAEKAYSALKEKLEGKSWVAGIEVVYYGK